MTPTLQPPELQTLEEKLELLLKEYQAVLKENSFLKIRHEELVLEKAKLLEKTTLARTKVEAMITRLKAMEES